MPLDPCQPCCNPAASFNGKDAARINLGVILCRILGVLEGAPSGGAFTPISAQVPFGSVPLAFAPVLTSTSLMQYLRINNTTNQPIEISFDAGVNYFTVPAGTIERFEAASNNMLIPLVVSARALIAPVSGKLEIYGGY